MRKLLFTAVVLLIIGGTLASCGSSRRGTGCPMSEKIIH